MAGKHASADDKDVLDAALSLSFGLSSTAKEPAEWLFPAFNAVYRLSSAGRDRAIVSAVRAVAVAAANAAFGRMEIAQEAAAEAQCRQYHREAQRFTVSVKVANELCGKQVKRCLAETDGAVRSLRTLCWAEWRDAGAESTTRREGVLAEVLRVARAQESQGESGFAARDGALDAAALFVLQRGRFRGSPPLPVVPLFLLTCPALFSFSSPFPLFVVTIALRPLAWLRR